MPLRIQYADDDKVSVRKLFWLRIPSLAIGLILGLLLSFVVSNFEKVLSQNIALAYFIPFVVYLASAVGNQTQSVYARDLKTGKANFKTYLLKEFLLGKIIGLIFGVLTALVVFLWFHNFQLTLAVSLSVLITITFAPLIALIISQFLQKKHEDPAIWAGPLSTIVQDTISVVIYGIIASVIFL